MARKRVSIPPKPPTEDVITDVIVPPGETVLNVESQLPPSNDATVGVSFIAGMEFNPAEDDSAPGRPDFLAACDEFIQERPDPQDLTTHLMAIDAAFTDYVLAGANELERDVIVAKVAAAYNLKPQSLKTMWTRHVKQRTKTATAPVDAHDEQDVSIPEPVMWSEPVDGNELALEIKKILSDYISADERDIDIMTMWILATYCHGPEHDWLYYSPRLGFTAPAADAGKSTAMEMCMRLAYRGLSTVSMTPAVLLRIRRQCGIITVGLDERDRRALDSDLEALIKDGHKRGGKGYRCESLSTGGIKTVAFNVFGAMALAGIEKIGDEAVTSRTLTINMKPRTGAEHAAAAGKRLRDKELREMTDVVNSKGVRWAADNVTRLNELDVARLEGSANRMANNWGVLWTLANAVGDTWAASIRNAYEVAAEAANNGQYGDARDLVTDIMRVAEFVAGKLDKEWHEINLSATQLLDALQALPDSQWAGEGGHPKLTSAALGRRLASLGASRKARTDWTTIPALPMKVTADSKPVHPGQRVRTVVMKELLDARERYAREVTIKADVDVAADGTTSRHLW
jgi:hypothetical protein